MVKQDLFFVACDRSAVTNDDRLLGTYDLFDSSSSLEVQPFWHSDACDGAGRVPVHQAPGHCEVLRMMTLTLDFFLSCQSPT